MDYDSLKKFSIQILEQADQQSLSYNLYWYSPETRKLRPESKIGYYDKQPSGVSYNHGCKLVITFPRLAFNSLESIINTHLTQDKQIAYREDYKSSEGIGFDVYQRVETLKLFIEPDNWSSKKITIEGLNKHKPYWLKFQRKALEEEFPPLTPQQITQSMDSVALGLKNTLAYLKATNDPDAQIQVRRKCEIRHRMIRVDLADNQTKRDGFSNLVLVFGTRSTLPHIELPREPKKDRKPRNDSIASQYQTNPSGFKYYDKFGIFEVYDKK